MRKMRVKKGAEAQRKDSSVMLLNKERKKERNSQYPSQKNVSR